MRSNYIQIGPAIIRVGSKHLASWGFPRLCIGGLSVWSWTNEEWLTLASYHPASSITWLWAVYVDPLRPWRWVLRRQERMPRRNRADTP